MKTTLILLSAIFMGSLLRAQVPAPSTRPDQRFKVDLLLVVAHPDDESEIGGFLAKAIFDEHKRVAVVYGTRGNGGGNAIGQEQAAALGAIREIEGRRALGFLGISDVWFLDGPDTPGQDVLRSLETWDHGHALGKLVRLVRLTRPDVIATWLPAYTAGENHGDHQAAGVLATEAFDLAGDPTKYPEQVTPPRDANGISNLTEGLHTWQPQKLYYFSDASHFEFLKGQGPQYPATEISPSKGVSYAVLSARECSYHLTQSDSGYTAAKALENNTVDKTYFNDPSRFIFGKAHVDANATGDVFAAVQPHAIAYVAPPGYHAATVKAPDLELGGPWRFYQLFLQAHGLQHLSGLTPPELEAGISTRVTLPILIDNPGAQSLSGEIKVDLPDDWKLTSGAGAFQIEPGQTLARSVVAVAPGPEHASWKDISVQASSAGSSIGETKVRVRVVRWSLPQ
jgi:LmbE family N-acetylglucosaminyl deacetylase